ncbi:MAG: ABC transporter ATP-binding protein [Lachnospiraceae bacterium]|nr:ABC transporter ATP-binding protein [Lachnospiraceae bacterium]
MENYLLEMKNISKIYGNGIIANDNVSFNLKKGEIHALVGENGAGKSTLMKILFGMEPPSSGEIILKGEPVRFSSSKEAISRGIGMVHQHFMLVDSFSVAQNIILGMEPKKRGFVNETEAVRFTREISKKYNLEVEAEAITRTLPVGVKQKIEILKALARGAQILILDEPTAVLTPQETNQLFDELINLKKQGHTIVFISHKIPEIKKISDRITVMRAGRFVSCAQTEEVTEQEISNMIMGCEMDTSIDRMPAKVKEVKITVDQVSYTDKNKVSVLKNLSFSVHGGIVFGIAGVQGNGQVELVDLLTRKRSLQEGEISLNGASVRKLSVPDIRKMQFGYVPEDRMNQGIAAQESIEENMISNRYETKEFCRGGLLDYKKITRFATENIAEYEIRCAGSTGNMGTLSGGNMQKVVVARECSHEPEVLLAEQPTRGVDVGAAHIIHKKIMELRDNGCAVLLISADLSEVLKLSDVIAVMYEGEFVAFFEHTEDLNEEKLGLYMLGLERHSEEQIGRAAL